VVAVHFWIACGDTTGDVPQPAANGHTLAHTSSLPDGATTSDDHTRADSHANTNTAESIGHTNPNQCAD
jgi:hypothetical protein